MKTGQNSLLVSSRFVQVVRNVKQALIWHSLFGRPKVVSLDILELLQAFGNPRSLEDFLSEYDIGKSGEAIVAGLIKDYFLISVGFDERGFLETITKDRECLIADGSLIKRLVLIVSEECNFRCTYCIHFGNLKKSERAKKREKIMTFQVAKDAVDKYVELIGKHKKKSAAISFSGAETLLAWPVIEQIASYYQSVYQANLPCNFSILTNSSLITPEIASGLTKHEISVTTSIDGFEEINDRMRRTKAGKGTFSSIMRGLDILHRFGVVPGISITLTNDNFASIDEKIVDWAHARGVTSVRISIDTINLVDVSIDKIVALLFRLRKYGKGLGINIGGQWTSTFGRFNSSALDGLTSFCGASSGEGISVSPSGDVYACTYSKDLLGNIERMDSLFALDSRYHAMIIQQLVGRMSLCRNCEIEGQCSGGCMLAREFVAVSKIKKVRQNCALIRRATKEFLLEQLSNS